MLYRNIHLCEYIKQNATLIYHASAIYVPETNITLIYHLYVTYPNYTMCINGGICQYIYTYELTAINYVTWSTVNTMMIALMMMLMLSQPNDIPHIGQK